MLVESTPTHLIIPGLATAHSHAFQRALRGRTQRHNTQANSFWSWRKLMYDWVEKLTPESIYAISRFAYAELAMSGVTTVGEFHYVHHQAAGRAYAQRTELAQAVIQAAVDVGLRICLIRTAYMRGGYQQELDAAQRRFVDAEVDLVLRDVADLQSRYADSEQVRVALSAHSIRAVPIEQIVTLKTYANQHNLPFHMHVCEQRAELEACQAEYGTTPIDLLQQHNLLSPNFVGVHATHLNPAEIAQLGQAEAMVCLCRTTERDLGDGLPPTSDLVAAGAKLCVGVDSHACENAFEEIRAVELDERSRLEARHSVGEAEFLLDMGTAQGYRACGFSDVFGQDKVWLRRADPALAGASPDLAADAVVFSATPRAVERVQVGQNIIVEKGRHRDYEAILAGYLGVMD